MKRSVIPSGTTPGKPAIKIDKRDHEQPKSRNSLFDFKPEKVWKLFFYLLYGFSVLEIIAKSYI